MKNHKQTTKFIISAIEEIAGKENGDLYRNLFKDMSAKDFDEWYNKFLKTRIK